MLKSHPQRLLIIPFRADRNAMNSTPHQQPCTRRRLSLLVAVSICSLACLNAVSTRAQDARVTPSATTADAITFDGERLLSFVLEQLKARFAYPERLEQPAFIAATGDIRKAVATTTSLAEAAPLINTLLAELKISHTALYTPDDVEYPILLDAIGSGEGVPELIQQKYWANLPSLENPGAFFVQLDGKWFVDGVLEGSPAESAGLKVGDEIVDVDGAPLHPVLSFRGKAGRIATLHIRRTRDSAVEAVDVPIKSMVPSIAFANAASSSAKVFNRNGKRIGYMHLWSSKTSAPFYTALANLSPGGLSIPNDPRREAGRNATTFYRPQRAVTDVPLDGIIIDLRGKVGGSNFARDYLEALNIGSPESEPLGGRIEFQGRSQNANQRRSNEEPKRGNPPFKGRTAILIDHHSRSALELEAYSFKREKMGPLIGTPTAGAVTGGSVIRAPGDALLYLAVSQVKAGGKPLEGVGVHPDIRVERPIPYANGADPVVDAALAHFDTMQ